MIQVTTNELVKSTDVRTPVLIVGSGPAGITTSLALARMGVPHIVLNRYNSTAHTPRAHILNQRLMEIMRDLGVEGKILAGAMPNEMIHNNVYFMSMAGDEIVRHPAWGGGPDHAHDYRKASPCKVCNLPQHELEPLLVDEVLDSGFGDIRMGEELVRFEQDEEGVTAWVRHRASGHVYTIRSDYLVGADGARSMVMEQLGLKLEGEGELGRTCFAWIKADLTRYVEHRPGVLYWQIDFSLLPKEGGSFICVKPWKEWIVSFMLEPGMKFDPKRDIEVIDARVRSAIGDHVTPYELINASVWNINRLYAPRYSKGRVFCMGDAVHRHPPTNGLGANTCVGDAFNLAWKLKYVLDKKAGPELLESFSVERAPVGRQIVERANKTLLSDMSAVPRAIGLASGMTNEERWEKINTLHDATEEARGRRQALDEAISLQDFGFNAIGVEIGYRYRDGARVDDGTPEPMPPGPSDITYQATTWPGARLPHAWIQLGRKTVSTLDVVGKGQFVLLTGPGGGQAWNDAAEAAFRRTGVRITVLEIATRSGQLDDVLREWRNVREVEDDGAVLVRPDAHVGWRSRSAENALQLPDVMADLLCLRSSLESFHSEEDNGG